MPTSWQLSPSIDMERSFAVCQSPAFTQKIGPKVKPECFRVRYVASRNMPYGSEETSHPYMLSGGRVLKKGQPVWLKKSLTERRTKTLVPAYVEHLGVISL